MTDHKDLDAPRCFPSGMPRLVLGIESSCDETAAAILRDGREVVGQFIASQVDLHRQFGGVVPEAACRAHMEAMIPGLQTLFDDTGIGPADLEGIAVTNRPGLIGALLIGVMAAKGLALAWDKPLVGVNHIEAHIAAAELAEPDLAAPYVALVVSGGHTNLYHVPEPGRYERLAWTLDDAAGEAFDKVAKLLDLGFPGGPAIQRAAEGGRRDAYPWRNTCLPKDGQHFSFSGIKTAVLYAARGQAAGRKGPLLLDAQGVTDAAATFQEAAVHALVSRTRDVVKRTGARWIALGGGVAANARLREAMAEAAAAMGCRTAIPPMRLCTDNAVMVAARGAQLLAQGITHDLDLEAAARAL